MKRLEHTICWLRSKLNAPSFSNLGLIHYLLIFVVIAVICTFAVMTLVATSALAVKLLSNDLYSIYDFRHYHHDLVIGSSSIFAGSVVIFAAYWNISTEKQLSRKEDKRKLDSAMSTLPLALSELYRLCKALTMKICDRTELTINSTDFLNDSSIHSIQLVVEYSDEKDREEFRKVPIFYQIAISKFRQCMENRQAKNKQNDEVDSLDIHNEKSTIVHLISLLAISGSYMDSARKGVIQYDRDRAVEIFWHNLRFYNQENTNIVISDINVDEYFKDVLKGDKSGFLDPDYFNLRL